MTVQPVLEERSYQQLLDEALARIPVHNPEYTNFNGSDPGVTLLELFAFLTEAVAYRANQIPDRNKQKFLSLLGVPAAPSFPARGIVEIHNERGDPRAETFPSGLEVRAGSVAYRTTTGLDVLPVEARALVKQPLVDPSPDLQDYYRQLYASLRGEVPARQDLQLYQTTPQSAFGDRGVALQGTADNSLWVALLLRDSEPPTPDVRRSVRQALAGRTLSLGITPVITSDSAQAEASGVHTRAAAPLGYLVPQVPSLGLLPQEPDQRVARYRPLEALDPTNVLVAPGIVQVRLPSSADQLGRWENLDPLEAGSGDFPPSLEDSRLEDRVVTWLRIKAPSGAEATLLNVGINAAMVVQREHVVLEPLPDGSGEPDQSAQLAKAPVIPGTATVQVTPPGQPTETWTEIDDLLAAGPEVPVRDPRHAPGTRTPPPREHNVFAVDAATGRVRFGDGARGRRPPRNARMAISYDFGVGAAGNVGARAVSTAPTLPASFTVSNPLGTWGGADAESVDQAAKQASRHLQHRDRLVTSGDFESIVRRTPGVQLGRVEVLPTYNPQTTPATESPGSVTVLALPAVDALHPEAPEPDRLFLNAICQHLAPRRLVTTEIFLRGPDYVDVWASVGLDIEAGRDIAVVYEAVRQATKSFLAPIGPQGSGWADDDLVALGGDSPVRPPRGWPLGKSVNRLEMVAVANRVPGVLLVRDVLLGGGSGGGVEELAVVGLQLPRLRGVEVGPEAVDLDLVRGRVAPPPSDLLPVPVVPETC